MEVYLFQHTECYFESAMRVISVHSTKKGAYHALNKYLNNEFNQSRECQIKHGKSKIFDHVFQYQAWAISTEIVQK